MIARVFSRRNWFPSHIWPILMPPRMFARKGIGRLASFQAELFCHTFFQFGGPPSVSTFYPTCRASFPMNSKSCNSHFLPSPKLCLINLDHFRTKCPTGVWKKPRCFFLQRVSPGTDEERSDFSSKRLQQGFFQTEPDIHAACGTSLFSLRIGVLSKGIPPTYHGIALLLVAWTTGP